MLSGVEDYDLARHGRACKDKPYRIGDLGHRSWDVQKVAIFLDDNKTVPGSEFSGELSRDSSPLISTERDLLSFEQRFKNTLILVILRGRRVHAAMLEDCVMPETMRPESSEGIVQPSTLET